MQDAHRVSKLESSQSITTGTTSGDFAVEEATLRGRRLLGKGERYELRFYFAFSINVAFQGKKKGKTLSSSTSTSSSTLPQTKTHPGATYPLPEGYAAYVLPKDQMRSSSSTEERTEASTSSEKGATEDEELLGLGAPTRWKAASVSSLPPASFALTYWKLDEHPTPMDGQRRALDWVATARAVAVRVPREEVDRAMME